MTRAQVLQCLLLLATLSCCCCYVMAVDLDYTPITTVTDETRYITLNPDAKLIAFKKVRHVKGNYFFSIGERITGDGLILNFLDKATFTKAVDIEVQLKYPASGNNGATVSAIEIYADLTSDDADAFVADGGINNNYVHMLLACNQTKTFTYELFMYGY